MVNHSGENICGTGACKSNKADTLPLKELSYSFSDNTASKQTTPLNLSITGLKYSCPMESKLDFPSFKGKKKKSLLSKANLFSSQFTSQNFKTLSLQKSYKHESAWLGDLLQYWSNRSSGNIWHVEASIVFFSSQIEKLCFFFFFFFP